MKKIIYKFNNGTSNIVEVTDEFYSVYMEMEKEIKNSDRRETRRHQSLDKSMEGGFEIVDSDPTPEQMFLNNEAKEELDEALKTLTTKQRTVFLIYVEEGLSFAKIGKQMGISKDTVKEHYWVAVKKLQKFFKDIPPQKCNLVATRCRQENLTLIRRNNNG